MKKGNLKIYVLILLAALIISLGASSYVIGNSVQDNCEMAQREFNRDCVNALIGYVEDESNDVRSRNSAIWALGQLGDAQALPTLEKLYTGYDGSRSDLNTSISQYELKKAIKLASGGLNITAPLWRFRINQ